MGFASLYPSYELGQLGHVRIEGSTGKAGRRAFPGLTADQTWRGQPNQRSLARHNIERGGTPNM